MKLNRQTMHNLKRVILLIETSREFGRELLRGIARYSRLNGPWSFYREPGDLKSAIPRLTNWNADGIIMRNTLISHELLKLKLPTILALHETNRPPHLPAILTDASAIACLAAEHLLNRGLNHFAFCGFDKLLWSNERKLYFNQILNDAGYNVHIYKKPAERKYNSWDNEQYYMTEWLKQLPKPIGILACNDDRAQHVLEGCKSAGLHVPEEVAVLGVDNDSIICSISDPPLSSIALNVEPAGYGAADLLNRLMNGEPMQGQEIIVTATHVVKRQSTDVLSINDSNIVNAIRFIKQNAKNKISVNDVVAQTYISRRSLEEKFKKNLYRTINEEIKRVRVEQITQVLIESSLSISEITSLFNFTGAEHISRYFKKEKGLGLREFRKLHRKS